MKSAVLVPTNRPERIQQFIEAWRRQFQRANVRLIVVEDAPQWTVKLPDWVEHYCHANIEAELGDKAECIPTRSGGCRDFGFWLAWQDTSINMVVSLDDDVLPLEGVDFLGEHWRALETPRSLKWWPLFPGFRLRGEPYNQEMVKSMLNLGLWQGFPDVDAYCQLGDPNCEETFREHSTVIGSMLLPAGYYFPCCGMNFAVRREAAPFVYFPKLPEGYKRFDDIWMGLMFKRLADRHGWAVSYGTPLLRHDRASNPLANLRQEMLGYGHNEQLWQVLDQGLGGVTPIETYNRLVTIIGSRFPQLAETARLMTMWASLFVTEIDSHEKAFISTGGGMNA